MQVSVIHISWGANEIVDLSILHFPPWIHYEKDATLALFVENLQKEETLWGIYVWPPNPFDPNKNDLEKFTEILGSYKWKVRLIVDICVEEYWKQHWWEKSLQSYDWWVGLKACIPKAINSILHNTHS